MLFDSIMGKKRWMFGTHVRHDDLDEQYLKGKVQTFSRDNLWIISEQTS